ncbi:DUF488 domain-containing protein [Gimesia fumaroli]|uniref:Uncharacterized protein n=1 Tax=Gimesia fumaroli TaxID=2527976 RepID=A0A518IGR9_9PLAN|nr:DUF488 domain-containing protein [Gimesia fumaroli]QDV52282.1 hypothetical protein Enr17x_43420 [Gimesia fumaroli]
MSTEIRIKRIYEDPSPDDGYRVLVDRLWPRGMSKAVAQVDLWLKEFAPSNELRKWFHADPSDYDEFVRRYQSELRDQRAELKEIVAEWKQPTITLLTAIKDPQRSHVPVLKAFLTNLLLNG